MYIIIFVLLFGLVIVKRVNFGYVLYLRVIYNELGCSIGNGYV